MSKLGVNKYMSVTMNRIPDGLFSFTDGYWQGDDFLNQRLWFNQGKRKIAVIICEIIKYCLVKQLDKFFGKKSCSIFVFLQLIVLYQSISYFSMLLLCYGVGSRLLCAGTSNSNISLNFMTQLPSASNYCSRHCWVPQIWRPIYIKTYWIVPGEKFSSSL